jgi:hypothetical protein
VGSGYIDDIIARGQNADVTELGKAGDRIGGEYRLVRQQNFRLAGTGQNLAARSAFIAGAVAKRMKGIPG